MTDENPEDIGIVESDYEDMRDATPVKCVLTDLGNGRFVYRPVTTKRFVAQAGPQNGVPE